MRVFLPDVGDHVVLPARRRLDLGGAYAVRGPDTGDIVEVSLGMDLVCVAWDKAKLRGWYEVETLFKMATVRKVGNSREGKLPSERRLRRSGILTKAEMLRFASIQQLLTRLGFMENQEQACMQNTETYDTVAFSQIAGKSVEEFVRRGIEDGWLKEYVKEA